MAQQENGWPLGLQPLHMRVGLMRNHDFSGSISFNTLLTASASSSTDFSSDLDTESTGSFFHDKSITLGSLIGVSSILELSGRSARGRRVESFRESLRSKKSCKSKIWLFSLCSKTSTYTENASDPPSLGHFLEVERQAANDYRRSQSPIVYEPYEYEFTDSRPSSETNSLFVNGLVAPPQSSPLFGSDVGTSSSGNIEQSNRCGVPVLLSCMCGQPTN